MTCQQHQRQNTFWQLNPGFLLKSEKKGKTLFLCRLRSHCIYSSFSTVILQYPFQGRCSFHHHLYASPLQECPQSLGCCQLSGPWPLSQFLSPWRMLQEVRMATCMKTLCDSRVLWKLYHSTNSTCAANCTNSWSVISCPCRCGKVQEQVVYRLSQGMEYCSRSQDQDWPFGGMYRSSLIPVPP